MSERRVAQLLGRLESPAALRSVEQAERADARHQRALVRRISAVPSRRRRGAWVRGGAAAVLAAAAGTFGVWLVPSRSTAPATADATSRVQSVRGELSVLRGRATFLATRGDLLLPGDRAQLSEGASTTIEVSNRAKVELSDRARLDLVAVATGTERLQLAAGRGRFSVGPPRGAFVVESPHLRVEVKGTEFSVTVEAERSCVVVYSGRVVATSRTSKRHATLGSEQAFSSDGTRCTTLPVVEWLVSKPESTRRAQDELEPGPAAAEAVASAEPEPPAPGRRALSARGAAAPDQPRSSLAPQSTLPEENRLLLAAIAARREGRLGDARHHLEQLLRQYPATPLRAAAENELGRVVAAQ